MHRLLSIAGLLIATALPQSANAFFQVEPFTVLGCSFNGNVPAFTNCLTSASAAAVKEAEDALKDSPAMAQIGAELEMLDILRQEEVVGLANCLNEAGIDLGTTISTMAANPRGTAANRLQVMVGQRLSTLAGDMSDVAMAARSFDPANPASAGVAAEQAFDQLLAAAETDPVARCGIPVLQAQKQQIKQAAAQAYALLQTQIDALVSNAVTPALHTVSQAVLADALQSIGANGNITMTSYPLPGRARTDIGSVPSKQTAPPPQKRTAAPSEQKRTLPPAPPKRTAELDPRKLQRERTPRTRAGATFLNPDPAIRAAGQAVDTGRRWLATQYPDDLQKIAHAELAAFLLRNPQFSASTGVIDALGSAQRTGAPAEVSLAPLNAMLDELRESNHDMYSRIALSTINFYGHETIDLVVDPIVGYVVGHVSGQISLVDNTIAVACTTGHFVSQLPCGGVKALVVFLAKQVMIPTIKWGAVELIRFNWDEATECAAVAVGLPDADGVQNCNVYQPVLQWFPPTAAAATSFILPQIEDSRRAFLEYHTAVLKLAESVAVPPRRR
jgi:hypothetical protein